MRSTINNSAILFGLLFFLAGTLIVWAYPSARLVVPESEIIFSHRFHVDEQETDCDVCHIDIATSKNSTDRNLPTMDECGVCHDVDDDELCGKCHLNADEPIAPDDPSHPILFDHAQHLQSGVECQHCHADIATADKSSVDHMPTKATCMGCHDGNKASNECALCHNGLIEIDDLHPVGWKAAHGDRATMNRMFCTSCHQHENSCLECHRGDNLNGRIHDLNFQFTHGLEAKSKTADCKRCHETQQFCVSCHQGENRMPQAHSLLSWRTMHGSVARMDIENCASCHDDGDPTCARSGCHFDQPGLGNDPRIHDSKAGTFEHEGAWHDDGGYFCFQCHDNSRSRGVGFCGYCHD